MNATNNPPLVVLDCGSTAVKAAAIGSDGMLASSTLRRAAFPPRLIRCEPGPWEDTLCYEADPEALRVAVEHVLQPWLSQAHPWRLGFACQRSSFLLFERCSGASRTAIVSWRDRRAEAWCRAHPMPDLATTTGLRLGPHYALPKLAAMLEHRADLARGLASGELVFGTIETWLMHCWSSGRVFATDPTMAARTLGVRIGETVFDPALLARFGVPPGAMPTIVNEPLVCTYKQPTHTATIECAGIADQQAGAWAALGAWSDPSAGALLNFGTGTFVLLPTGTTPRHVDHCLSGPLWPRTDVRDPQFLVEGTVHAGASLPSDAAHAVELSALERSTDDLFCLPDIEGTGAPYWTEHRGPTWLPRVPDDARIARQVALEGLVFRTAHLLTTMEAALGGAPRKPLIAGGVAAREPMLCPALAAVLARPVVQLNHPEAGLTGAAARFRDNALELPQGRVIDPDPELDWLRDKRAAWHAAIDSFLAQ